MRRCPDDGTCHHECAIAQCFRVDQCEPLSGVFPDDTWPDAIAAVPLDLMGLAPHSPAGQVDAFNALVGEVHRLRAWVDVLSTVGTPDG